MTGFFAKINCRIMAMTTLVAIVASLSGCFGGNTQFDRKEYFSLLSNQTAPIRNHTTPILSHQTIANTQQALNRLNDIVASGGWRYVPVTQVLRIGVVSSSVVALRVRLIQSGDLAASEAGDSVFDTNLAVAVARFQARHGLKVNGVADGGVLYAINISANERLAQLNAGLRKIKSLASKTKNRYIFVNVPAARLEAVENDQVVSNHRTIVGSVSRKTPNVMTNAVQINFNPYWHVPRSIIRKDLIPYMRSDPNYLSTYQIRVFNGRGKEVDPATINWQTNEAMRYSFVQDSGSKNSLGSMRINIPNRYTVFLHDTPRKTLFKRAYRFYSSGCIRVEDIAKLAAWLIESKGWSYDKIIDTMAGNDRTDIAIRPKTQVIIDYVIAWATDDGAVIYHNDIYNFYNIAGKGKGGSSGKSSTPTNAGSMLSP